MATQIVTLDQYQAWTIQNALLIGLESLAEVERLIQAFEYAEAIKEPIPGDHQPIHPTSNADALQEITTALRFLHSQTEPRA